jgi:hypothetical protein
MFNPYRFGKYLELPKILKDKKSIINIKNDDDYCLLYCFGLYLAIYHYKIDSNNMKNKDRKSNYIFTNEID